MEGQPEIIDDRAHALATCPASAPRPRTEAGPDGPAHDARQTHHLDSVIRVVRAQFDRLDDQQRGEWWVDFSSNRVVLQVTNNLEEVLAALRERVEDPNTVALELVRYSRAQLNDWAQLILAMDDIEWSSVGFENPNNRIEVQVRGRAEDAWQRIVRVVDPCAFRVEGGVEINPF